MAMWIVLPTTAETTRATTRHKHDDEKEDELDNEEDDGDDDTSNIRGHNELRVSETSTHNQPKT